LKEIGSKQKVKSKKSGVSYRRRYHPDQRTTRAARRQNPAALRTRQGQGARRCQCLVEESALVSRALKARSRSKGSLRAFLQKLLVPMIRQLRDVGSDPARLIFGEHFSRRSPARLIFIIEASFCPLAPFTTYQRRCPRSTRAAGSGALLSPQNHISDREAPD
jgi:hypothetical protein